MKAVNIRTTPPTLWCRETNRVIQELFWGGWVCYEASLTDHSKLEGRRVGVAECYSYAQYWLFGKDTHPDTGTKLALEVVEEPLTQTPPSDNNSGG